MLTIKVTKNNTIRRASVERPQTIQELRNVLTQGLDLNIDDSVLTYVDDEGDNVSLVTDSDLQEALRQVQMDPKTILRITLRPVRHHRHHHRRRHHNNNNNTTDSNDNSCHRRGGRRGGCPMMMAGGFSPAMLAPLLQQSIGFAGTVLDANPEIAKFINQQLSGLPVHHAICDGCDTTLTGNRHKCKVCPDFDFCDTCLATKAKEHGHEFDTITPLDAIRRAGPRGLQRLMRLVFHKAQGGRCTRNDHKNNNNNNNDNNAPTSEPKSRGVPHPATCDGCNARIFGLRYKCVECPDFDFCSECHTTKAEAHGHVFAEIASPAQARAVMIAAREKLQQQRLATEAKAKVEKEQAAKAAAAAAAAKAAAEQEAAAQQKPAVENKVQPKKKNDFERNLDTLESMGFTDRERNIALLVKNKNSLFDTIQQILQ